MISGFKTQLKEALSSAVGYFQDSGDPNAACVKAANEAGFNPDQADRLVETFNTARVICHYKSAEDKTSSCSLADKAAVRKQLNAIEDVKSAEYSACDYGCYKQAEVDWVVPEVKVAEIVVREEPLSKEAEDWLRIREEQTVRELLKTAEEEARLANAMADRLAEKIAMSLSRNVSIDDVHDKVARIVTAYAFDDRYSPAVEKIAEFIPAASDPDIGLLRKYAAMHVIDTSDLEGILPVIKEAADFVAEAAAMEAYAEELRKDAQQAPEPDIDNMHGNDLKDLLMREQIRSERQRRLMSSVPKGDSGGKTGGGGSKTPSVSATSFLAHLTDTAKAYSDNEATDRINKATDSVNNLRRQLILQDLLVNDKVLSQVDPNTVAAAFRSINQISSDSTLNKEILRSMLRNVVQSVAISPYDAKTLADLDKSRRQVYEPARKPAGGNSHE